MNNKFRSMTKLTILRRCFQVLALGIFVFQMQNSIFKYFAGPIVDQKILSTIDDTKQPIIYICKVENFNYSIARAHGYDSFFHYTQGKLAKLSDSNMTTWQGRYGNISHEYLFSDFDNESFISYKSETKKVYLTQTGFCKKMTQQTPELYIKTNKKSMILLVDPYLDSEFNVLEMHGGRLYFGPTNGNFFDSSAFHLKYRYLDKRIHDGQSCMDYDKIESSYGNCIGNIMKKYLLECYGCLPPWFPREKGLTCETEKDINQSNEGQCADVKSIFERVLLGKKLKMFDECLSPCLKMKIQFKRTHYHDQILDYAKLSIDLKNAVVVEKATYSYDIFNLVVDIGSALGMNQKMYQII